MSYYFKRTFDKKKIKLIILDFDGTLADTKELTLRIIKKHLGKINYELAKKTIEYVEEHPTLEGFLKTKGTKKKLATYITKKVREDYAKEYGKIRPCKNLHKLKMIKQTKIVITNNTTEFAKKTLKKLRANYFEEVFGIDKIKNKTARIKKLRKRYKLKPEQIIYVGDKTSDVEVARKAGCYSVIVSNKSSWSKPEMIKTQNPDYTIKDLGELRRIVKELDTPQLPAV